MRNILCSFFSGNSSHSNCHNCSKYLFTLDLIHEGDELIWDIAIKGILSSRVCSWITFNAHIAGDPDNDNLLPIFGQIHIVLAAWLLLGLDTCTGLLELVCKMFHLVQIQAEGRSKILMIYWRKCAMGLAVCGQFDLGTVTMFIYIYNCIIQGI